MERLFLRVEREDYGRVARFVTRQQRQRPRLLHPGLSLTWFASALDQVQTILNLSKATDTSPLAFTVKCAWKLASTLDPSDPRATR